ncbi:rod shape-determining protein MreC [Vagococcus xieshaowenii]|uniref:Cell shape-determining protein MreC n=1 Tax=Vagococcus xieshaowenii TaxID=2562451 RepID=A0A4Z0D8Q5_9ENTE|nr:rod shape-determining protein MreC [Vagococcus xieshaowenii]QCA27992.1 rod shape-determining protein MreC [Vagococcus xieshaowenii]TFZ41241.1 rod shape-determining protein MreC [Vagococcus xieshaowenii]
MKKYNVSKNMIIAIILTIIVVVLITVSALQRDRKNETSLFQAVTNDLVATLDKGLSYPIRAIEKSVHLVGDVFGTYEENTQLKKRLDSYAETQVENNLLKKENKELREQLTLGATLTTQAKVNANVISRSPDNWQDILIIDRGEVDGLEVNMPVMGAKGLIGRVISVNKTSSKVELLTSTNQNSNYFPAMITTSKGDDVFGLLEDYDEATNLFIIKQLNATEGVKKGDKVITSGLGSTAPKGLVIGTVEKIESTNFGLEKEVYVKPATSLYDISIVTVVKRMAGSGE